MNILYTEVLHVFCILILCGALFPLSKITAVTNRETKILFKKDLNSFIKTTQTLLVGTEKHAASFLSENIGNPPFWFNITNIECEWRLMSCEVLLTRRVVHSAFIFLQSTPLIFPYAVFEEINLSVFWNEFISSERRWMNSSANSNYLTAGQTWRSQKNSFSTCF